MFAPISPMRFSPAIARALANALSIPSVTNVKSEAAVEGITAPVSSIRSPNTRSIIGCVGRPDLMASSAT